MAATGFATTRWSPGTMPTPTRTLHEARKSLEVGQHLSKILPDQLLVRLHCAHRRWWPVIASPSQFSHRNPKACRWRPAVRFRWLIWSKKVCDVPGMAQGVSPLRVLNTVRLLVFCWRACLACQSVIMCKAGMKNCGCEVYSTTMLSIGWR